ncbi:MAG TPA: hypothetical protein VHW23_13670 [Kofleriaceae bacterium]|jgi:hypothetical protein|nr:hypothetical protein [Kofleriaceae bacterium]
MQLRELLVIGLLASTGCGAVDSPGMTGDDTGPGSAPGTGGGSSGSGGTGTAPSGLVATLFRGGAFRTPIPASPAIDPQSAQFVALLDGPLAANTVKFGVTVRYSHASDPGYRIVMTPPGGEDWGQPFDQDVTTADGTDRCNPLHIPDDLSAPPGDDVWRDGWVYIIDTTKRAQLICAIWQASKVGTTWAGSFGGVLDAHGTGANLAGAISGSNIPHNPILASEVAAGAIEHALSFASAKNDPDAFRAPATKTDGKGQPGQLQQGMRFQLDPGYDCGGLANRVERMVCVALQKYGMYDNDSTTGTNGFLFETDDLGDPDKAPPLRPGDYARPGGLYAQNGLTYDYQTFPNIPLSRMRLLRPGN